MPVHSFHIPVMGTGFTVDTPLKVARFGLASVISLVDDVLLEQVHQYHANRMNLPFEPVPAGLDARMQRIRRYLDFLADCIAEQMRIIRAEAFTPESDITRYFELLPDGALRTAYEAMLAEPDATRKTAMQDELRTKMEPGMVEANIMTHPDRLAYDQDNQPLAHEFSTTMLALQGFAESRGEGAVVFSAGYSPHLYRYTSSFDSFFATADAPARKKIVLKVSDYRSAAVQGRFLAKSGVWVSEYRVESGVNCGGHAFLGTASTLPATLRDFRDRRDELVEQLFVIYAKALEKLGKPVPDAAPPVRVTVQGGIATAEEDRFLREHYRIDGTGWGSPMLLVPEVTNVDPDHMTKLLEAKPEDVQLSHSSPLGVRFWMLTTSASEEQRKKRIADGTPGSPCVKHLVEINDEFGVPPLCAASRVFMMKKIAKIRETETDPARQQELINQAMERACICHDLGGGVLRNYDIDDRCATCICCGPNIVYFSKQATLREMTDHIYGRKALPVAVDRPHVFVNELQLYVDNLDDPREFCDSPDGTRNLVTLGKYCEGIREGIAECRELMDQFSAEERAKMMAALDAMEARIAAVLESEMARKDEA